jgi:hypothetical protein
MQFYSTIAGMNCVTLVNAFAYVMDALYRPDDKFVKVVVKL